MSLGSAYDEATAEEIRRVVEKVARAIETDSELDRKTRGWLENVGDDLRDRFERAGLIEPEAELSLRALFDAYFETECSDFKTTTKSNKRASRRRFFEFFDPDQDARALTIQDAQNFVRRLDERYKEATRAGTIRDLRRVWNWAIKQERLEKNPWNGVKRGSYKNKKREYFVSRDDYKRLLDACITQEQRALIALYRIGGLRKNEALLLRWEDVDLPSRRMLVRSPKTERSGKGARVVPLFPELREELETLWENAPEGGSPFVIASARRVVTKTIEKIVFYAGLNRWERLIQNLRSSRAIEINQEFGITAEGEWIGHSATTAENHYLHVIDADFERATQDAEGTRGTHKKKTAHKTAHTNAKTDENSASIFENKKRTRLVKTRINQQKKGFSENPKNP